MRHALTMLALCGAAAPAMAQGFTGTVQLKFAKDTLPVRVLSLATRGGLWHATVTDEKGHVVVHMTVFDSAGRTARERSYQNGLAMRGELDRYQAAAPLDPAAGIALTSLQKQRKVAGRECTDYEFEFLDRKLQGCFTTALGPFFVPPVRATPPMSDGKQVWAYAFPDWALALSENPLFPLRIWDEKQNTLMEVRSVEEGALPSCFGQLPPTLGGTTAGTDRTTTTAARGGRSGGVVVAGRGGGVGMPIGSLTGAPPRGMASSNRDGCPLVRADQVPKSN